MKNNDFLNGPNLVTLLIKSVYFLTHMYTNGIWKKKKHKKKNLSTKLHHSLNIHNVMYLKVLIKKSI